MLYEDVSLVLLHSLGLNRNFYYRILHFKMSHCWAVIIAIFHAVNVKTFRRNGIWWSYLLSFFVAPIYCLLLVHWLNSWFLLVTCFSCNIFSKLVRFIGREYFLVYNLHPLFPHPPPPPSPHITPRKQNRVSNCCAIILRTNWDRIHSVPGIKHGIWLYPLGIVKDPATLLFLLTSN